MADEKVKLRIMSSSVSLPLGDYERWVELEARRLLDSYRLHLQRRLFHGEDPKPTRAQAWLRGLRTKVALWLAPWLEEGVDENY